MSGAPERLNSEAGNITKESENESAKSRCNAAIPQKKSKAGDAKVTPAMQQYHALKAQYADCLLFYRMGDFYELFFQDALDAAEILDIALTKRGKHEGEDIPMCGVPAHAADMYLQKLIASGRHVAICEQLETPDQAKKARGHKAVVRRDMVRLVTPGTITEDALLDANANNFLTAVHFANDKLVAISWLDITTGEWWVMECHVNDLPAQLARLAPRELLVSEQDWQHPQLAEWHDAIRQMAPSVFRDQNGEAALTSHFKISDLAGYGEFSRPMISAMGALLHYVQLTQMEALPRLDMPECQLPNSYAVMDAATRRNLELTQTLQGERKGSLLATLDRTVSAAGGRVFAQWLTAPLRDVAAIHRRLDGVDWLRHQSELQPILRAKLREIADMERAISRLSLGRGGPRDMAAVRQALGICQAIREALFPHHSVLPPIMRGIYQSLHGQSVVMDTLEEALTPEVPMLARDGGFIAPGYRADLDEWRRLRDEGKRIMLTMEQGLRDETGINSLKVKHNNVLGYFIEITQIHEKKVPAHFIHRQSLAGTLRYTTTELNETARNISDASDKALQCELALFEELQKLILEHAESLVDKARAAAMLDALVSMAELAMSTGYVRPELSIDTQCFEVKMGRHPVVERALEKEHKEFIANDCMLSEHSAKAWLITGPNMGGKSTFLRQNIVIQLMAQIGSFVPAASARLSVADKLFCRVGAADDLARGRSTFMVEMLETAAILNQATSQSFVVLDEIGRGTATYDGMAIAWAVMEHLSQHTKCHTLFATHYHELTAMARDYAGIANHHAGVKEYKGQLIFMHQMNPGVADRSYGVQVAALAGLPKHVVARAKQLLNQLETIHSKEILQNELPLFGTHDAQMPDDIPPSATLEKLSAINPDLISPREAHELLYELKALLKREESE